MDSDILAKTSSKKPKRPHPTSVVEDESDDETPKKSATAAASSGKPRKAPQKKKNPPFIHPGEEEQQQTYLENHKFPKIDENATAEAVAHLLEPYEISPLASGGPLPAGWKIVRQANAKHVKEVGEFSLEQLYGEKREKEETTAEYIARNKGLRGMGFTIANDEEGRARWLLRLRDFQQLAVQQHRKSMDDDPKLELFIEKPVSWLLHVGEFSSRIYNWDSSEFFPTFCGLVPTSLLLHKIKLSKAKKQSTEDKKKKEKTTEDAEAPVDAAKTKPTINAAIKLFDENGIAKLFSKLSDSKEKMVHMLESSAKTLEAMPAGDDEARNLFASMWKTVYNDGKQEDGSFDQKLAGENKKKRRDFLGRMLAQLAASEKKDDMSQMICDAVEVDGKWKKAVEEKGGMVNYMKDALKTPGGKLLVHVFFATSEASGKEAIIARRPDVEDHVAAVEGFKRNIEGFSAHLKEIQTDMKRTTGQNVETLNGLFAKVDDLNHKLEAERAKNAKLEKKLGEKEEPSPKKKAKKAKKEEPAKKKATENGKKKKKEESSTSSSEEEEEEGEESSSSEEDLPAPKKIAPPKAGLTTPAKKVESEEEFS